MLENHGSAAVTYWIFKSNPKEFGIDDRLKQLEPRTCWSVEDLPKKIRPLIKPGDIGFVWRVGSNHDQSGISARMVITSGMQMVPDLEWELPYWAPHRRSEASKPSPRVLASYTGAINLISRAKLEETPAISYSELFAGTQPRDLVIRLDEAKGRMLDARYQEIGWPLPGWPSSKTIGRDH